MFELHVPETGVNCGFVRQPIQQRAGFVYCLVIEHPVHGDQAVEKRRSSPAFVAQLLPVEAAELPACADCAQPLDHAFDLRPLRLSGGYEPSDREAAPSDEHLFPVHDVVQQREQVGLRVGGANLGHFALPDPTSSGNRSRSA